VSAVPDLSKHGQREATLSEFLHADQRAYQAVASAREDHGPARPYPQQRRARRRWRGRILRVG
jgi:hypothetical protein